MTDSKIVDRAKKLLAMSASPNEHEAAQAAERLQVILAEHNLSLAELQDQTEDIDLGEIVMVMTLTNSQPWRRPLGSWLAKLYFSQYLYGTTMKTDKTPQDEHTFVGAEHNAIVAKEVFEYLIATVDRLAQEGALQVPPKQRSPYRVSFRSACVRRLMARIQKRIEEMKQGGTIKTEGGSNLPALRSMYDKVQEQLDAAIEQNFELEKKPKVQKLNTLNTQGDEDGREAGDKISLDKQIADGGKNRRLTHQ